MLSVRVISLVLFAFSGGCAASATAQNTRLRILNSQLPAAPVPMLEPSELDKDAAKSPGAVAPRIGAPGGSGAGSRRVLPAQSGNETVGGLPAGIGAGAGVAPAGRG